MYRAIRYYKLCRYVRKIKLKTLQYKYGINHRLVQDVFHPFLELTKAGI